VKLIKAICGTSAISEEVLSKVIFNIERQVSFDEFIALLHEV